MYPNTYPIEYGEQSLWLDPSGALFWEGTNAQPSRLLVADLHLGRETTLQRSGIALPEGGTAWTLERLESVVHNYQPKELWILGDLIHARCSFSESSWKNISHCFLKLEQIAVHLIEGNHDRASRRKLGDLPLEIHKPPKYVEPFWLAHDAEHDFCHTDINQSECLSIAGHIHPGFRLSDTGERLKCFHMTQNLITLPAFGAQTGTMKVTQAKGARIFLATGTSVIPWREKS